MTFRTSTVGPPMRSSYMETEVFRQVLAALTKDLTGIVSTFNPTGDLFVTQQGTPTMGVTIAAGRCIIAGSDTALVQGSYYVYNDAPVNLVIAAADATNPRIDLVVVSIQDSFYIGGINNRPLAQVITGTPAPTPVAPAVPASSIVLASVAVAHAPVASIVNANITDLRTNAVPQPGMGIQAASVATAETTASAAYADLATIGPQVTVVTGKTALVILSAAMGNTSQFNVAWMGYSVSGASTIPAADANAIQFKEPDTDPGGGVSSTISGIILATGLTPGSNIFVAKYHAAASTANFAARRIAVIPL